MSESQEGTSVPLDMKHINVITKQGVHKEVPALHIGFAMAKVFVPYDVPPPLPARQQESEKGPPQSSADIEEWLERMKFLEDDLGWLLKLPHNKFWCQVTYDKLLHSCLDSFLTNAPRFYDLHDFMVTKAMKGAFQRVHRLIFKVYLRMSTYKESKDCHITPHGFADLIYQCFLFDIPKMIDISTLYMHSNQKLLRKMIDNIFKNQPCYNDDLEKAASALLQALKTVEQMLGLPMQQTHGIVEDAKKLNEDSALNTLSRLSWRELQDILMYLVDLVVSLSCFLDIYPSAAAIFHIVGTECRIAAFYDTVFPPLKKELADRSRDEKLNLVVNEVKKRISLAKYSLVKIFHEMIYSCCIQPILEMSNAKTESESCVYVEELMDIMSTVVSEKSFINNYQREFPFEDILELLSQSDFAPDPTRTDYILGAISGSFDSMSCKVPVKTNGPKKSLNERRPKAPADPTNAAMYENGDIDSLLVEGATAGPVIMGPELESLVTQVQDLLPDLNSGFVQACLEYFNYDTEKVINSILEDSLPPPLKNFDKNLPRLQNNSSSERVAAVEPLPQPSLLSERRNIFDNDEFDVFRKDSIDTSRIQRGKRDDNLKSVLHNKEDLQLLKTVVNRYDITTDTYDDPVLYEDEYDDTYDEHAMGPEEPLEEDEMTKQRPFTIPRVLRTGKEQLEELDLEEGSSGQNEPELGNENGPSSSSRDGPHHRTFNRPPLDVKGKPKGQGQDDKTLRNRSQKERHKSTYSNHNRRAQSDRKRASGMLHL